MSQETERYQLENNGNTYLGRAKPSGGGADVEANPEGTATADLEKLKVDDTIYGIPEGTEVVANPTLAGTESALTGLQVGNTKYVVPVDYKVHTYQQNKVYTSSDSDYQQLIDDLDNGRMIKIGVWVYQQVYKNASTAVYSYSRKEDATTIEVSSFSISITSNSITIPSTGSLLHIKDVRGNTTLSNSNFIPSINVGNTLHALVGTQVAFSTTAPTADNTSGYLDIRVLSSEPATRYNGYLYIITA